MCYHGTKRRSIKHLLKQITQHTAPNLGSLKSAPMQFQMASCMCLYIEKEEREKKKITISQSALNYCYMTEVLNLVGDFRRYYAMCSLLITSTGLPCLSIKVFITHAVSVWDCCSALFCKLLHVLFYKDCLK